MLVPHLLAIMLAMTFVVFRWIVLPIKKMSDRLHAMRDGSGELLAVPTGHENSSRTPRGDINELTSGPAHAKDAAEQASLSKGAFPHNDESRDPYADPTRWSAWLISP